MKKYSFLMILALIMASCAANNGILSLEFKKNVLANLARGFCLFKAAEILTPQFTLNGNIWNQAKQKISNIFTLNNKKNVVDGLAWASLAGLGLMGPLGDLACCGLWAYKSASEIQANKIMLNSNNITIKTKEMGQQLGQFGICVGASLWALAHGIELGAHLLK